MALPPIGFWSYTSTDDSASQGRLSGLRVLLAAQLQQSVGKTKVRIFQDVAAIPPGTGWEAQIEAALQDASFFIPIVTPGFLQSEWCNREVARFRQIMEARGRDDLILPIHYWDVDAFDSTRASECFDPEVYRYLSTRPWVDFRRLNLRDPTSEDVQAKLAEVREGVLQAL